MQVSDVNYLLSQFFTFFTPIFGVSGLVYGSALAVRKIIKV